MSPNLLKLLRERDIAFSKYKATKSECHLSRVRTFHNKLVGAIRKAKCEFFLHSSGLLSSSGLCITHSLLTGRGFLPPSMMALSLLSQRPARPTFCFSQSSHNSNCQCSSLSSMASEPGLSSVTCTTDEVHKLLCSLKTKTASGPNGL